MRDRSEVSLVPRMGRLRMNTEGGDEERIFAGAVVY